MFSTVIICIGLAGQIRGGIVGVAAAKVPPQSGSSSWSWRRNNLDDDIPIMGGDHFRDRRSRLGIFGRRSKQSSRRSHRDDDITIAIDDDSDDEPPPFFFGQDDFDDNDNWPQREHNRRRKRRRKRKINHPFDPFRRWALETTGVHIPRINLHLDPITILKLRKSWHNIIPGAIIRVGAELESKGVWRLRGCVEDKLIGGRFTFKQMKYAGDVEEEEDRTVLMEYSKSWLFAGAGSTGTRFNLCATYDLRSQRGSARFGFRSENTDVAGRYQIITGRKGFCIIPIIPLDRDGRLFLEAKTLIDLPQPEFVIGTDYGPGAIGSGESLGMGIGGDIDVDVKEVNVIVSL
jgi:hypothetical protein